LPALVAGDLRTIEASTLVWRVYRAAGGHVSSWDRFRFHGPVPTGRFDHQAPPQHDDLVRGILYAALDGPAAIAEAFQDTRTIDRRRAEPWIVGFELGRDVTCLDLTGRWPTRAGASQAISFGRRDYAQAWSRAIYEAYDAVHGLVYPSAMAGGSRNVALYERSLALPHSPRIHVPLVHRGLDGPLRRLANDLGYDLV
jgi:RES domain-containing protein